jgi:hypothetical protein
LVKDIELLLGLTPSQVLGVTAAAGSVIATLVLRAESEQSALAYRNRLTLITDLATLSTDLGLALHSLPLITIEVVLAHAPPPSPPTPPPSPSPSPPPPASPPSPSPPPVPPSQPESPSEPPELEDPSDALVGGGGGANPDWTAPLVISLSLAFALGVCVCLCRCKLMSKHSRASIQRVPMIGASGGRRGSSRCQVSCGAEQPYTTSVELITSSETHSMDAAGSSSSGGGGTCAGGGVGDGGAGGGGGGGRSSTKRGGGRCKTGVEEQAAVVVHVPLPDLNRPIVAHLDANHQIIGTREDAVDDPMDMHL